MQDNWIEEARRGRERGREILEDDELRGEIKKFYRDMPPNSNHVLIIADNEKVSGYRIYFSRYIGFTEENPSSIYMLEGIKEWKRRMTPRNILNTILHNSNSRYIEYVAKGKKRELAPAMKDLKKEIRRLKEYVEMEAPSEGLSDSVNLAKGRLTRLQFEAFGCGNAALEEIMESHGYGTDKSIERELKKVIEAYGMAGVLDTRNVQRKLEKEREHRVIAREEAYGKMSEWDVDAD